MATLYRKYRPQNFEEVVNQNHIKLTLEHEIKSGKIAHAYLFCGPRAVGKTTLARVFAKAINCLKRKKTSADPCNQCDVCREITAGRALDINEIDAASHTGVDNVRENIIANTRVSPSSYSYKVFIIDEVHMLSISAFNALLKVIEEPPEYVVFILCTTEVHKVPMTIISRCQRFDFKRIGVTDVVKKLNYIINSEKIKVNKSILEAIARQSEGHMRDAESLLGQIVAISGREITQEEADLVIPRSDLAEVINLIACLVKKDSAGGIRLINKLVDEGVDLKIFTNDLVEILRRVMLTKINPGLTQKLSLELGENLEIEVSKTCQDLAINQLLFFIERFIKAHNELKGSFITQLPLELAIIELCAISPSPISNAPAPVPQKSASPVKNTANTQLSPKNGPAKAIGNINKEQILEKWNEVLARVKQHNHSLSFILRVCQPKDINNNQLCLAFKYKFHKDRVSEINIKAIVEKVLQEVYRAPLTIEAVIDENLEVGDKLVSNNADTGKNKEQGDLMGNLLKTFGGKVVE